MLLPCIRSDWRNSQPQRGSHTQTVFFPTAAGTLPSKLNSTHAILLSFAAGTLWSVLCGSLQPTTEHSQTVALPGGSRQGAVKGGGSGVAICK